MNILEKIKYEEEKPVNGYSKKYRCIYAYFFPDNSVYVGLTYNLKLRHSARFRKSVDNVNCYIKKTNLIPKLIRLTEYIPVEDARILEGEFVEKYRKLGFNVLNKAKTGVIGGDQFIWNKETCKNEALKFKSRSELKFGSGSCYASMCLNGWLDELCSHMEEIRKPNNYYTKKRCKEIISQYTDMNSFVRENINCYTIAKRNGWLEEWVDGLEDNLRKPNNYYNKNMCSEIALNYDTKKEFKEKEPKVYDRIRKNGWLIELCSHMKSMKMKKSEYTIEYCKNIALKYSILKEFVKNHPSVYNVCLENKWMDIIGEHFISKSVKLGHWNVFENCKNEALKYNRISHFKRKSCGAYSGAIKNGWIKEITSHMEVGYIPSENVWTKQKCVEEIKKYESITEIRNENNSLYNALKNNMWYDELILKLPKRRHVGTWDDYDKCKQESEKYNNRSQFKKNSSMAYKYAKANNWLDEFFPKQIIEKELNKQI